MSEEKIPVKSSNEKSSFFSKVFNQLTNHVTTTNLLKVILIIVIVSFILNAIWMLWYPEQHMFLVINGKDLINNPFLEILVGTIVLPLGIIAGLFGIALGFLMAALGIALASILLILGTSPLWAPIVLLVLLIKKLLTK